jgi:hypothetical protein
MRAAAPRRSRYRRPLVRLGPSILAVLVVLGVALPAFAQTAPPPAVRLNKYSTYERDAIDDALEYLHAVEDHAPEGKIVEGFDIITLEVFEKRDLVPGVTTIFNVFHATTKPYVIEREILLRRGEPFRQPLVDDTIRNLRGLFQLSLVLTLTTKGSGPDKVRLVVITKDVWSLRPNWNIQLTNGGIQLLTAQPAEINLAGTHQTVNGNFVLQPNSLLLGAGYINPRLLGTRIYTQGAANIILNLPTGEPEGSTGGVVIGQPLYSPLVDWAWDAQATWSDQVQRRYVNASLGCYPSPTQGTCASAVIAGKAVPFAYRAMQFDNQYTLTRSFGWTTKHDFSLGVQVNAQGYPSTLPQLDAAYPPLSVFSTGGGYDPKIAQAFINANVPLTDNRVGPFLQYHTYSKSYARLLDFDTIGLQEDFRLGHDIYANVYPVVQALGSTRNFVGFDVAAQYTVKMGDGLVRAAVESITEVQTSDRCGPSGSPLPGAASLVTGPVCDASIDPALHIVSPTMLVGRFVFDGHFLYRFTNYLNQNEFLGGDTRLRGYPANYFTGHDILDENLEFRTRSIDILTAQLALVAFYDVGAAFNTLTAAPGTSCRPTGGSASQNLCPVQGIGTGLRILFPQLDRIVFRTDLGFPVGEGRNLPGVTPVSFFFSLGQAFTVPQVSPGTGTGLTLPQISGSPTTALSPPP